MEWQGHIVVDAITIGLSIMIGLKLIYPGARDQDAMGHNSSCTMYALGGSYL